MNKWYSGNKEERTLQVDLNSIKKSKHIRDIFDIGEDESVEYDTTLGSFAKANKNVIVQTRIDTDRKKDERMSELCDAKISNEEMKFKVQKCTLKKLPVIISSSTKQSSSSCSKEESIIISRSNSNLYNKVSKKKSQLSFTASSVTQANSQDYINTVNKDSTNTITDKNDSLYVPCINCSNLISVDNIESHSDNCLTIKEEVKQVEQSKFSYHLVDFKLKKLKDHFQSMQESNSTKLGSIGIDKEIIQALLLTAKDTISTAKIAISSINSLKKFIISIDVSKISLLLYRLYFNHSKGNLQASF